MARKRQRRPGPKSSKKVDEDEIEREEAGEQPEVSGKEEDPQDGGKRASGRLRGRGKASKTVVEDSESSEEELEASEDEPETSKKSSKVGRKLQEAKKPTRSSKGTRRKVDSDEDRESNDLETGENDDNKDSEAVEDAETGEDPATAEEDSTKLNKQNKSSHKDPENLKKDSEKIGKRSVRDGKASGTSKKDTEVPEKDSEDEENPESIQKDLEVSNKGSEASGENTETPEKDPEASESAPAAIKEHSNTEKDSKSVKKDSKASKKGPGTSKTHSKTSDRDPEADPEHPDQTQEAPEDDPLDPLASENNKSDSEPTESNSEDKSVESDPPPTVESKPQLRLVPLSALLKPSLLDDKPKQKSTPRRSKKNASLIEISSDDEEMISIGSTSSDESSQRRSTSRRKRDKENDSTNKLSNGTGKQPVPKDLSINLEKMPDNVNKLMKCYRVEQLREKSLPRIESWSETDDFENMITTSKIDRTALDRKNQEKVEEEAGKKGEESKKKKGEETKKKGEETKKKGEESKKKPEDPKKKGKTSRKPSNSDSEPEIFSDESEEVLPVSRRGGRSTRKSPTSTDSDARAVKGKETPAKSSRSSRRKASSSEDEGKSKEAEKPQRATRSRKSPEPGKSNDLKLKINLKKKEVVKSDSESSMSGDEAKKSGKEPKSDGENSEIPEDEKSPVLDQKLRKRNKFEANSAFNTLKQIIEKKKEKKKPGDEEPTKRSSRRNGNDAKEEKNNNGSGDESEETDKSGKKTQAKRKRLISSSDEELENGDTTKTPAKKRKMSSAEESDFEPDKAEDSEKSDNSDSDSDQPKKRKAKNSGSESNDTDDLDKDRPKNKRRKRIKKVASSDEDGEGGEKGKSGRKNIRKMMRADKLDVSTKEAGKIEKERKQRIEERQKMYNQVYDERPEEAKEITQLVLDFDEDTKKPLLKVDKNLVKKLKPHQANGVKFMWDACFESLERCEKDVGSGCILAHCMGLGKTLQVVTLVHTLLKNSDDTGVSRVLVVCPLSTVLNWVNEFNIWLKHVSGREDIYIYEINKLKQNADRANKLMEWHNDGGVMILSYDMFRNLTNDTGNRLRKKIKESLQTSLVDPGPDLVVCDEGHLLKNEKTSISKAMMKLRTLRRIVLTGTPLQNNLKEYYCMVQFVKPNLLGKYTEYMNRFVNPIMNGQYTDSSDYDIQVMRRRSHVLHKMLDGCVQRRDYAVLAPFLPPKHEYVMSIKLTPMQVKLYKYYMENRSRSNDENGGRKGSILFQDFQNLQRIWTAPLVLRYNSNRYEAEMQRRRDLESEEESEGSLKDFIDDSESAESTSSESSDESDDDAVSINSDEVKKKKKKKKKGKAAAPLPRRTRAMAADLPSDHEAEELAAVNKKENPTEWWMQICPEEELNNIEHSSKLMLLMSILEECEAIGDKLLVFSQSLYSLDVIEHFLNYIDERTQQNDSAASFTGSWSLGQDYFRLDGSTPVEQRNAACKHFNSPSNPRARLFLISTRAGGLGINLVAANRVIIFDVSWNPSHDIQSIFRVYRFGQTKPCYIYRFLAMGTMEEKIYERQVTKQAISKRVIDEQQIDRHYNQNDLQELYRFDLEPDDERILPILPKDRLFANMLKKFEDMIYKYHEHDTLLENKEEETLNEEERKQAWEEFEAEKNRPQFVPAYVPQQPRGVGGPVTSNNIFGIRTDVLLKLLSMKARLDNPGRSEMELKGAIPVLMQELYRQMERGELTLYQQLIALSSSLEVPTNYGGQFRVNENQMVQSYNSSLNSLPSTSNDFYQRQMAERQQQFLRIAQQHQRQTILASQLKQRPPPRVDSAVIEID